MLSNKHHLTVFLDDKEFTALTGLVFRGFSVTRRDDRTWNIVARAQRGHVPVYTMVTHDDITEGLDVLARVILDKRGDQAWFTDKFAKR